MAPTTRSMTSRSKPTTITSSKSKPTKPKTASTAASKHPIAYPGGKSKAVPTLRTIWDAHFPNATMVISPFFGAGSFECNLYHKLGLPVHANDVDTRLVCFWRVLQSQQEKFTRAVEALPLITKAKYDELRERTLTQYAKQSKFDRALDYYLLNRCTFGSLGLSGGYAKGMALRMVNRCFQPLRDFDLKGITFSHGDWKRFLESEMKHRSPQAVIFLDPPYCFEKQTRMYGTNGDLCLEFDHTRLRDYLKTKHGWMMSYNNVPTVRDLYQNIPGVIIYECRWSYSMCESSKAKNKEDRWAELVIVRPFKK